MIKVRYHDSAEDSLLSFAVIIAKHNGRWVFCRHKNRTTYEFPGGHREPGESILEAAMRELYEETGADDYEITPICAYSVIDQEKDPEETFGMLYYADILTFQELPDNEMEEVLFFRYLPDNWTYPTIQPQLFNKVNTILFD